MNSLVFLPLMAAMVIAAPGGVVQQFPASTQPLAVGVSHVAAAPAVVAAAPAVTYNTVAHAPAVVHAPAVAHVSVPVTKTVHYETRPVVTGYSQQIIKPAIPHFEAPALQAVSVQQHVVHQNVAPVHQVAAVAAPAVAAVGDATIVEARSAAVVAHAAPVAQVASFRAAQAGDFGPLVTKEQVLAPVRTHTQITPQITQVQPEVHVRNVVHNVDVAHPVAVHTPVQVRVAAPAVHTNVISAPAVHTNVVSHTNVVGHHTGFFGHAGHQFVL